MNSSGRIERSRGSRRGALLWRYPARPRTEAAGSGSCSQPGHGDRSSICWRTGLPTIENRTKPTSSNFGRHGARKIPFFLVSELDPKLVPPRVHVFLVFPDWWPSIQAFQRLMACPLKPRALFTTSPAWVNTQSTVDRFTVGGRTAGRRR